MTLPETVSEPLRGSDYTRITGTRYYRIRNTEKSSDRLGPCSCCGKRCADVYALHLARAYVLTAADIADDRNRGITDTQAGDIVLLSNRSVYGHEECLQAVVDGLQISEPEQQRMFEETTS